MTQPFQGKAQVHPTAIIDPEVELAEDVVIGPYAVISGHVSIGAGTIIKPHCVIGGATRIGRNCKVGPGAYLGQDPQHIRFVADPSNPTWLIVGDNVTIREGGRIHRAFHPGLDKATRIGDRCFLMGATHVAHDCVVESDVIMADGALLGGHCHIGRNSFLGGGCTLHQFTRVGRLAIISGNEPVSQDVPAFAAMRYGRLKAYNAVGCRRAGMDRATISAIRSVYRHLQDIRVVSKALAAIRAEVPDLQEVREIVEFISASKRGIVPVYQGMSGFRLGGSGEPDGSDD